jgi:hypothetical protein
MGISWGRKPDPLATTGVWRVPFALALVTAAIVSGFPPAAPPAPPNEITPTLRSELQALLDVHVDRIAVGDDVGYRLTVDPTREDYARCMDRLFSLPGRADALRPARLIHLERVGSTYIRAVVQERDGPVERYFRRAGVFWNQALPPFSIWREAWRWYLSVPHPNELPATAITRHEGLPVRAQECLTV